MNLSSEQIRSLNKLHSDVKPRLQLIVQFLTIALSLHEKQDEKTGEFIKLKIEAVTNSQLCN